MRYNEAELTFSETESLRKFKKQACNTSIVEETISLGIRDSLSQKRQKKQYETEYVDFSMISPTLNICERLFSNGRLILTEYRKRMTPETFEWLLFLKVNRSLWNVQMVCDVILNLQIS